MTEGTCFICNDRIREDQASVVCNVGGIYRLVYRHHADERRIKISVDTHNVVDEIQVEKGVPYNVIDEIQVEKAVIL